MVTPRAARRYTRVPKSTIQTYHLPVRNAPLYSKHRPVVEYLEDRAGDSLRAVEWYRDDEAELVYLRDDIDLEKIQPRVEEIHHNLTWRSKSKENEIVGGLGEDLASVSLHEEAALVHLPVERFTGVVIGPDPVVARSPHRFVSDCREQPIDFEPPEG